ncbi:MAG: Holliday junction branch migration protein RuvA [Clostridia bacterium]
MFYSLTGDVIHTGINSISISCGGVGFLCLTSQNTLSELSGVDYVTVFTYLHVREDVLDLYGFSSEEELEWFKMLISVNGVGPKAALNILSQFTISNLFLAISAGDSKAITKAQGIGAKIAQRIILDLKDKIKSSAPSSVSAENASKIGAVGDMPNTAEAIEALSMLGYSQTEASVAVSKLDPSQSTQQLIKGALKILSGN